MNKTDQIFIVGSSRSGTTMLSRILGNHSKIFTFRELHFFSRLLNSSLSSELSNEESQHLLAKLLCVQKNGIFFQNKYKNFYNEAAKLLLKDPVKNALDIYSLFLNEMTKLRSNEIACEQTPNNMYYVQEILDYFPNAKIINMVRDQRDVLLSQKNKWKRKFLGASKIPLSEAIRSYVNYHPITTAKIWDSSLRHTTKYMDHPRVKIVNFEELIKDSEFVVNEICSFLRIDYQDKMLKVPVVGSSTTLDRKDRLEIDKEKVEKWKKGGLNNAEIYISQLFASNMMRYFSYELKKFKSPPVLSFIYLFTFPVKLFFAFFLNLNIKVSILKNLKKIFLKQ